jgi:hypothetical protein
MPDDKWWKIKAWFYIAVLALYLIFCTALGVYAVYEGLMP